MKFKRIFLIVMDSLGCGEDKRSAEFNDIHPNTIKHISENFNLNIPTMQSLGYGYITDIKGVIKESIKGSYHGKMFELSNGKDTLTGHFEMMGILTKEPLVTFTEHGFPKELIDEIEKQTNHKVIGNKSASGTEIIKELGLMHIKTGSMIIYTSADSVLQIACHEKYFGLDELYRCCEIVRKICMEPKWKVGRIIARPFIGEKPDDFVRTPNRHDYALNPPKKTCLDYLKEANYKTIAIGKIHDIFNGCGITDTIKTISNHDGMQKTIEVIKKDFTGLCFVNLVDFDSLYGHRRNVIGYGQAINEFDKDLKELINELNNDDLLILTADHGNDPTASGTDHTREYVPLLVYSKKLTQSKSLGIRNSFADLGQTIIENFNLKNLEIGSSFLKELE